MNSSRTRGGINFGCLTLILFLIVGGYVGFKFGRVYMARYFLNKKVFQIAGDAAEDWKGKIYPTDQHIAEAVLEEAQSRGVDITLDDILAERNDQTVTIQVTWEGDIVLPFYTHHFVFNIDHTRTVK